MSSGVIQTKAGSVMGSLRRGALEELGSRATFWLGDLGGWTVLGSEAQGSTFVLLGCPERVTALPWAANNHVSDIGSYSFPSQAYT